MLGLLADGDWHSIGELVNVAAPTVPPGIAYRSAERQRRSSQQRVTGEAKSRTRGEASAIVLSGVRTIVNNIVHGWKDGGRVEAFWNHEDGVRYIRLIEGTALPPNLEVASNGQDS